MILSSQVASPNRTATLRLLGVYQQNCSTSVNNAFALQDYQRKVAIKIIKSQSLSGDRIIGKTYKGVRKEIDKLLYLKPHLNIVTIFGLFKPHGIVLELAPMGDLQSMINKYQYQNNFICSTALLLTILQASSVLIDVIL